jgi:hypothetical protein
MAGARGRIADFWDEVTAAWLAGKDPLPDPLPRWYASYEGRGDGRVTRDAFAEPYVGDLRGTPRMVILGLNPGRACLDFQSRFRNCLRKRPWSSRVHQQLLVVRCERLVPDWRRAPLVTEMEDSGCPSPPTPSSSARRARDLLKLPEVYLARYEERRDGTCERASASLRSSDLKLALDSTRLVTNLSSV